MCVCARVCVCLCLDTTFKDFKKPTIKAQNVATFLLTELGSRPDLAQR